MAILSFEYKTRVRYKDTDQMGIMHHSNYIVMYEMARVMSPIVEVQSRYHYPAFYDEVLTVKLTMEEMPSARLVIASEIFNEQGKLINTGKVTLGFMNAETRRPCRAPEWFVETINQEIAKHNE